MKKTLFLLIAFCATAFADDSYKIVVTSNTVASNGLVSWNCTKNGTTIGTGTGVNVGIVSQARVGEFLLAELRKCKEGAVGTLTEVKESDSPPPIHGSAQHDSTVEATANKNAANGYAGVDSQSKVPIAQLPTGATSSTVTLGNDARLSDARTPLAHTHAESEVTNLATDLAAKVATTRAVNTTAPLGGGGALSTDLTLTCATCTVNVSSGTATFATTAIAAGGQSAAATISGTVTGILATDSVSWAYKTTPSSSTDARLIIAPVVAAGALSFTRENPTASSITPTAIVVNWKVVR